MPFPRAPFGPPGFSGGVGVQWGEGLGTSSQGFEEGAGYWAYRGPGSSGPNALSPPAQVKPPQPTPESCAVGPQTLRQFAAEALSGGNGQGDQGSFQTPRSRIGDHGLPVSPGGTVIRPPPGPPPLSPRSVAAVVPGIAPLMGQPDIGTGVSGVVDSRPA